MRHTVLAVGVLLLATLTTVGWAVGRGGSEGCSDCCCCLCGCPESCGPDNCCCCPTGCPESCRPDGSCVAQCSQYQVPTER